MLAKLPGAAIFFSGLVCGWALIFAATLFTCKTPGS